MGPHKFRGETAKDRNWGSGYYNPKNCVHCGKSSGHPVHQKKFRNKPLNYQLWLEDNTKH